MFEDDDNINFKPVDEIAKKVDIELKKLEKLIDMNLAVYDNAVKNRDDEKAIEHLELITQLVDQLCGDEIKLKTEKVIQ